MPYLTVEDIKLYYEVQGAGEPLVFIHGLGSSVRDWDAQAAHFQSRYRVVRFDVRGHGRSDKPTGPYSIGQFADDTAALLTALDLAPAHVVGWSLGGMIGFELAVRRPRLLKTLVVLNSGPELVLRGFKMRVQFLSRFLILKLFGMEKMGGVLARKLFPEPGQEALKQGFVKRWAENDVRAYTDALRALIGWSVLARLPEIDVPVLVLSADQDYTPLAYKRAYAARLPKSEVAVVADSRHATPLDQAAACNAALERFLSKHGG